MILPPILLLLYHSVGRINLAAVHIRKLERVGDN